MFHESRCKSFDRERDFLNELTVENLRWIEIYDDRVCEENGRITNWNK